ncbi:MAG: hypothetical protein ACRDIV_17585 [Ktedonobacteraceae bacterium]
MWNAPLTSGTTLSVAIGCALFLYGLSLGLLVAGACVAWVAASDDRPASLPQENDATISDDEVAIVLELVRDAVAGGGWSLCGDCYTRNLLMQLPLPTALLASRQEDLAMHSYAHQQQAAAVKTASSPFSVESIDNTRERPGRSESTHRVDLALPLAHTMPASGKNRPEQHLCECQAYHVGRLAPPYCIANERNAL